MSNTPLWFFANHARAREMGMRDQIMFEIKQLDKGLPLSVPPQIVKEIFCLALEALLDKERDQQ